MPNPLYNSLNGNNNNGVNQLITKFNQFKNTFSGDPKAEVQRLLNTGAMTQEQFNRLHSMANQLMSLLKK